MDKGEALFYAVKEGPLKAVEALLADPETDVNFKGGKHHDTPLMCACAWGFRAKAQLLLNHNGIDVNARNRYGSTAFLKACYSGKLDLVRLLADRKDVDTSLPDHDGCTPLWKAAFKGRLHVVKWLIMSGMELGIHERGLDAGVFKPATALEIATQNSFDKISSLLEKLMTDPEGTRVEMKADKQFAKDKAVADVFAMIVLLCPGGDDDKAHLVLNDHWDYSEKYKFFSIAMRLPMELQMVLSNRCFESGSDFVLTKDSTPAFRRLFKVFEAGGHSPGPSTKKQRTTSPILSESLLSGTCASGQTVPAEGTEEMDDEKEKHTKGEQQKLHAVHFSELEPYLKRLGHVVKRVILGCYWDTDRAAKVKVQPHAPTIIIFLAPKIVGTMTNPQKVVTGVVEEMRAHFYGWQVAVDHWHRKQAQEICELLTCDIPLTPHSFVALNPHREVLGDFMAKNTFFTGAMPLMGDTGEILESILLITEHAGISLLGEPAPDFRRFTVRVNIFEGKTRFSTGGDEGNEATTTLPQVASLPPFSLRQGDKISLKNKYPQSPFFTLGLVSELPWFHIQGPVCITAGHPFLIKTTETDQKFPVFNTVDQDLFDSAPPRQLGLHSSLRDLKDIEVSHSGLSFKVTADVALFSLDKMNFAFTEIVEGVREDRISDWHTWESLFEVFKLKYIKSISKRGAATGWKGKSWNQAPKSVDSWKRDFRFFMSGPAVRYDKEGEEEEEDGEESEDIAHEHQSRREDIIQKSYSNQLAFSFLRSDCQLADYGDSGSSYRDQDNKLLGFQSCLIDGGDNSVSLVAVVPAPVVRAYVEEYK